MEYSCIFEAIMALITLGGFAATILTLKKNNRNKQIDNIIQLKKYLSQFDEINANLLPEEIWDADGFAVENLTGQEHSKLISYLGFFEICGIMLKEDALSEAEFRLFFYYRLNNVAHNAGIRNYLENNNEDWTVLLQLINRYFPH